eukprot:14257-Eustigmatos_ZCMA.PRE.1
MWEPTRALTRKIVQSRTVKPAVCASAGSASVIDAVMLRFTRLWWKPDCVRVVNRSKKRAVPSIAC